MKSHLLFLLGASVLAFHPAALRAQEPLLTPVQDESSTELRIEN
jgi:hypothetical protein